MGKGKNAKRREKKRLQALQRAREEAAAAASAAPAAAEPTAGAARMPVPNEAAMVGAMMNITGQSREHILEMRDIALNYVQSQPNNDVVMAKAHQVLTKTTSELHASVEEIRGFGGSDVHVWHEVDGAIYGLLGGINGDIEEYNKDNPNSRYTLRRAYSAELQDECFHEFVLRKIARATMIPSHAVEKLLRDDPGLNSLSWNDRCVERAALLMAHCPGTFTQDTLRIGGVGWRDQQGKKHWEFG